MKATLEFNLPEDLEQYIEQSFNGKYHSLLFDMCHNYFKTYKRMLDGKESSQEEYDLLERMKDDFIAMVEEHNLYHLL
jgi:hypothetical protein